jgi:hypothetical protein
MDMGYRGSLADPDIWLKSAREADGSNNYEIVLCYVDNVLAISEHPESIINALQRMYQLKK